jgi:DNA polymerase-3 subunit beta
LNVFYLKTPNKSISTNEIRRIFISSIKATLYGKWRYYKQPNCTNFRELLFQLEHSQLTVTASDLQTVMITTLEVESQDTGAIAVPARLLLDTLRGLPDQPITFKVDTETFGTEIITENGRYKLSGENPIDFPKVPQVSKSLSVEIGADTLGSAIANTIFAVSSDDLRPAMTGVYVQLNSQYTNFVATDGHRLIRYRRSDIQSEQESSMIIPRKALNLLKSSLPSDDTVVTADFSSSNAFLVSIISK